ncbi:hypothetical protein BH23PSE1_BH23PSE1_05060 [soil metagenome]
MGQSHDKKLTAGTVPDAPRRIASLRELRALIAEDFATHNRKRLSPGFQMLAVYRFGVWVHDHDRAWLRRLLHPIYQLLAYGAANRFGIQLPYRARLGRRVMIPYRGGIVIHPAVRIGDDCIIRQNVTIGALGGPRHGVPKVGDRVEFGAGAVAIGPIRIGDDAIIGPNVVVRTDVPAATTVRPPTPEMRPRRSHAAARPATSPDAEPAGG